MVPMSAKTGTAGQTIPDWAIAVLATPGEKQPLHASSDGLASDLGEPIRVADGVVDLSGRSPEELRRHAEIFFAQHLDMVEFLKPSQQHFRRLLWNFAQRLGPDAVVGDIASNDAEFAWYFPSRHVLAMDLSDVCLQRAIKLGRVAFGVLADVRQPPMLDRSMDAIVSSNTLIHLPQDEVPDIVDGLLRCLKPEGMLATTLPTATMNAVIDRIGEQRVLERARIGGPVSRWWERSVHAAQHPATSPLGFAFGTGHQAPVRPRVFDGQLRRSAYQLFTRRSK